MESDPDVVAERATVAHLEPPVYGLDEPMWTAEDDETDCVGVGRVEAEAVGNLVSVVVAYDRDPGTSYVKLPGQVVERTWANEAESGGVLDALRDFL